MRLSIGPGTRKQPRPCSRAHDAVISAPDLAGASTTTVASVSPLMIRFRRGNVPFDGSTSGASSDTTAPPAATIASARRMCADGPSVAWPPPMTATVVPPARSVASCAAPSMPKARPDTTVASAATRAVAIRPAVARPALVARRVPTTATARARDSVACGAPQVQDVRWHRDGRQPRRVRRLLDRDHAYVERAEPSARSGRHPGSRRRSHGQRPPGSAAREGRCRRVAWPSAARRHRLVRRRRGHRAPSRSSSAARRSRSARARGPTPARPTHRARARRDR